MECITFEIKTPKEFYSFRLTVPMILVQIPVEVPESVANQMALYAEVGGVNLRRAAHRLTCQLTLQSGPEVM